MKKGFTLAEILITLAIIGVVSAMTIPRLVTANHKKLYASTLASTVTSVETALVNMINAQGVSWLDETEFYDAIAGSSANAATAAGQLGKFLEINGYGTTAAAADPAGYSDDIVGLDGTVDNTAMTAGYFFKTKNGVLLNFQVVNDAAIAENTHSLTQQLFIVDIDVNGKTAPNKWGRDIFKYAVDSSGKIFPYGGTAYHIYDNNTGLWTDNAGDYSCPGNGKGYGCAGRLFDNGFVMDY